MTNRKISQFTNDRPELRSAEENEPRQITGYAARFYDGTPETEYRIGENMVERIAPTAFDDISRDVISTFNHDLNQILGRQSAGTLSLEVDERGLRYSVPIDENDPDHQHVAAKIKSGAVAGSSFWFSIEKETRSTEGDLQVFQLDAVNIFEAGPVTQPAYSGSSSELRAEAAEPQETEEPAAEETDAAQADLDYATAELWAAGIKPTV